METVSVTIRFPKILWNDRERLREVTGAESVNQMVVAMYAYAMYHGRQHKLTNALFRLPKKDMEEALTGIVRNFQAGKTQGGNYLTWSVKEAVQTVANGQDVASSAVIGQMLDTLRKVGRGEKVPEYPNERTGQD